MKKWTQENPSEEGKQSKKAGLVRKPAKCSKRASEGGEERQTVPRDYRDFMEVFSKKECDNLPPQCPMDCAIEILIWMVVDLVSK